MQAIQTCSISDFWDRMCELNVARTQNDCLTPKHALQQIGNYLYSSKYTLFICACACMGTIQLDWLVYKRTIYATEYFSTFSFFIAINFWQNKMRHFFEEWTFHKFSMVHCVKLNQGAMQFWQLRYSDLSKCQLEILCGFMIQATHENWPKVEPFVSIPIYW